MTREEASKLHPIDCTCPGCAVENSLLQQCIECAGWLEREKGMPMKTAMAAVRLAMARKLGAFLATRVPGEVQDYRVEQALLVDVIKAHSREWTRVHAVREVQARTEAGKGPDA
jgi:hypothetical protein